MQSMRIAVLVESIATVILTTSTTTTTTATSTIHDGRVLDWSVTCNSGIRKQPTDAVPQVAPSCCRHCSCCRFSYRLLLALNRDSCTRRSILGNFLISLYTCACCALSSTIYVNFIRSLLRHFFSCMLLKTVTLTQTRVFLNSYTWLARCRNPNAKVGYCVSIYECPSLLEVVQRYNLGIADREFLQKSQCVNGYGRSPYVCCTPDKGYVSSNDDQNPTLITTTTTRRPSTVNPPTPSNGRGNVLPVPPECGPTSLSDKIYNGKDTALDQYPWMVLLEYMQSKCTCIMCVCVRLYSWRGRQLIAFLLLLLLFLVCCRLNCRYWFEFQCLSY